MNHVLEYVNVITTWLHSDAGVAIVVSLLGVSEALGNIPAIKANSIYELVLQVLQWVVSLIKK